MFNNSTGRVQIIGGMIGLEGILDAQCTPLAALEKRAIFLANARSGISLLSKLLSPSQIWMPSYLCEVMLKAIDKSPAELRFYEMNGDLIVPSAEWIAQVQKGDLVIFIDYFGFPCDPLFAIQAKEQGAWIVEDAAQALLSAEIGQVSDFVLLSPRKFLGLPDGGVVIVNCEVDLDDVELDKPPVGWWLRAFKATVLRREFDLHGGSRRWFELFQEAEVESPVGNYAMSEFSKTLLMHSFDYPTIAQKRVENYRILGNELGLLALFPRLPSGVVPLGFPIRLRNRDRVRQILFDHDVYPPIHWPIRGTVPGTFWDSHILSAEIMTLPCDQRYDGSEMERMARLVLKEII